MHTSRVVNVYVFLFFLLSFSCEHKDKKTFSEKKGGGHENKTLVDSKTTLRVGVLDYSMPLSSSSLDTITKKHGIYVDIAKEIAKSMNKKLYVYYEKDYYFQRPLRKGILADKCDLQFGIPDPKVKFIRKNKIVASDPYISIGYVVVVPKESSIKKITDLKQKKVAFLNGSPPQTTAAKVEAKFEPVLDNSKAMELLNEGKVDAAFIWGPTAGYLNKYIYQNKFIVYSTPYKWDVVIGIKADNEELLFKVNDQIKQLKEYIGKRKVNYGFHFPNTMDIPDRLLSMM